MKSIGQCGESTTVLPTESGPNGRFQDGTPGTESTTATQLIAEFLNSHLEEFANLIQDGLSEEFSATDDTQILRAINGLVGDLLQTANQWEKAQRYQQTELAIDAGAVTWDCTANPSAVLLLTTDVTSMTITGYEAGGAYDLTVIQAGDQSCATDAVLLWADGAAYEATTTAGAIDCIYVAPILDPSDNEVKPLASVEYGYAVVS